MLAPILVALALVAPGDKLIRVNLGTMMPNPDGTFGPILSIPFNVAGAYPTGTTVLTTPPQAITVVRSSTATYFNPPGVLNTAAVNSLRVEAEGALIEAAATNYALQSSTHPKTAEASASVPLGAAVAWHAGTGTMTLVAGTAVVTGLSCTTVAAGTPCSFTVTNAGTMSITTTAGTTQVQIEGSSARTSYIPTTTTATTRQADAVSTVNPLAGRAATQPLCSEVTATAYAGTWGTANHVLFQVYPIGSGEWGQSVGAFGWGSNGCAISAGHAGAGYVFSGPGCRWIQSSAPVAATFTRRAGWDGNVAYFVPPDGVTGSIGSGPSALAPSLSLGRDADYVTNYLNGHLKNVKFWNVPCARAR